jgi:hypothetical protein
MAPNCSDHLLVSELRFPRQLLLWALRQIRFSGNQAEVKQLIADALQRVGLSQTHGHLDILVDCFASGDRRSLQMLPPDRSWVSCDELLLLDALGTLQSHDDQEPTHFWQLWFPPAGVRLAISHAAIIAAQFRNAGLLLGTPEEYVSPSPMRMASALLH